MRFFFKRKDGGPKSTVTGFWLVEWKSVFSIVILCFHKGSREAYHSHAFNALTWWLKGEVDEHVLLHPGIGDTTQVLTWRPSLFPKFTPRGHTHKVYGIADRTCALSIRGPWAKTWIEYIPATNEFVTLTHGRKRVR